MIHRLLLIALTLAVLATGSGLAQDPDGGNEPLRLKKKKKPDEPGMGDPVKDAAPGDKGTPKKPPEPMDKLKEPAIVDPITPEENEKELFERIGRNMRQVEDRLLNKELNEATLQLEDDIIKDLDALIKKTENDENNGGGGGGGEENPENQSGEQGMNQPQGGQNQPQGGMSKQSRGKQGGAGKQQKGNGQQGKRRPGAGMGEQPMGQGQNQPMSQGQPMGMGQGQPMGMSQGQPMGMGQGQPMGMNPGGNNPGGNPNDPNNPPDRNADLYKDVWGHLPETVRAQMNAYSGKEEYMQKHRDLIKQYYRTLAEQGRNRD